MISILEKLKGEETNSVNIYDNMAFDVMADLGFGQRPEESMQSGAGDPSYMDFLHSWMRASTVLTSLRNLCELGAYIPQDTGSKEFNKMGEKMLGTRQKMGKSRQDIFTHLLNEDKESGVNFTQAQLLTNAQMLMVAGSDTTSVTLTCLFRLLSMHTEKQQKLYEEIIEAFPNGETPTCAATAALPFLNGAVQESLRMWPAAPSGPQATTPPSGYTIAGTFVPGNVEVRIPHMTMLSDPRYFPRPDEFLPERWTPEMPELVQDKRAFIAFGFGAHSCIGRPLAMNEMRTATARVIQRFQVQLGESYDDKVFRDEWKDYFTVKLGPCPLKFVPRKM
ncbi:cytochrome P450 [Tuber indicum]|nr:cytochrome P450 [Tuber indicum]